MSLEITMNAVAFAAVSGTAIKAEDVPDIQDKPIFGLTGDVSTLAEPLLVALALAGADEDTIGRIVTIMNMVDTIAEDTKKKRRPIGWLKKEIADLPEAEKIADLSEGEIIFLISYLQIARSITAKADESHKAPERTTRTVEFKQPGDEPGDSTHSKSKLSNLAPPVRVSQPLPGRSSVGWPGLRDDLDLAFCQIESMATDVQAGGNSALEDLEQRIVDERDQLGLAGQRIARDYIACRKRGDHKTRPEWFARTFN